MFILERVYFRKHVFILESKFGFLGQTINSLFLLADKDEIPWLYRTRDPEVYSQETHQRISTPILSEGGHRS